MRLALMYASEASLGVEGVGARIGRVCDRRYSLPSGTGFACRGMGAVVNNKSAAPADIIVLTIDMALSHLARRGSFAAPCHLAKPLNLLNTSLAVRQVVSSRNG
jgi:hypothetical protein